MEFLSFTAFFLAVVTWVNEAEGALSGFNNSPTQYHIQTDEGKERFFKFQTYNGQYRKERRLDDGSVIGSYGWVDTSGYLRMTDYIADSKGYRIVKSTMEFVGPNSLAESDKEKMKLAKDNGFKHTPMKHSTRVRNQPNTFEVPLLGEASVRNLAVTPSNTVNRNRKHPILVVRRPIAKSALGDSTKNVTFVPVARNSGFMDSIKNIDGEDVTEDVFRKYTSPLRLRGTGFIYKIPHQYHKEETERDGRSEGSNRVGSFGYVDPFGIRRVIHYNAGKDGFAAQRDFKYVGRQY